MCALKHMVVGKDERTKIKRVLVARFMSSDEEMEDANTRRKRFVTRPISWKGSKFRILKKKLDFKAFVNSSKRSQDQLTDQNQLTDSLINLAEDSWIVSSKFK